MNAKYFSLLILCVALVAGCGDGGNQTVTDGVDSQAIADYEAELDSVTGGEDMTEMESVSDDE